MALNYTEEQVNKAIENSRGIVSHVAVALGCSFMTAYKYIKKYPACVIFFEKERRALGDDSLRTIQRAIKSDDVGTAKWMLSRIHPELYSPQLNVEHSGNINFNFGDDDDIKELTGTE